MIGKEWNENRPTRSLVWGNHGCIGDDWINEAQEIPKVGESDVGIVQ